MRGGGTAYAVSCWQWVKDLCLQRLTSTRTGAAPCLPLSAAWARGCRPVRHGLWPVQTSLTELAKLVGPRWAVPHGIGGESAQWVAAVDMR